MLIHTYIHFTHCDTPLHTHYTVCVGCISGTTCCGTVCRGTCVCIVPRFRDCCWRVHDPVCEAENAACELLKAPIRVQLEAAKATMRTLQSTFDVARIALRAAEEVLSGAQQAVRLASDALEDVEDTFQPGLEVATDIAQFGLTEIVSINNITFEVSLGEASSGRFGASVKAHLLGVDTSVSVNLDLHDITRAAGELADRVVDGLSSHFS